MNRITDNMKIGTIGELLVQLRLLEHGVQAAPPIKDSGNDLIAVKNDAFRAIQVKTRTGSIFDKPEADRKYHILAIVKLESDETNIYLDKSPVYLVPIEKVNALSGHISESELDSFRITSEHIKSLFF